MASVYQDYQKSTLGMMENNGTNANPSVENNFHQSNSYAANQAYGNYQSVGQLENQPNYAYQSVNNVDYGYGYANGYYAGVQQQQQQAQPVQEQQVNGGVSTVLDYDLDIMSKFTTYLGFRLFDRKDTNNSQFISSLKSVLASVRLPLSSLILSNYFLLERYELDPEYFKANSDKLEKIYEFIVISLVLANKANDDNTFTNKSWSSATGINILTINKFEVEWLYMMGYRLHNTKMERYNELMLQFEKYTTSVKNHEMEQLRLMELKAQQLQTQAQAVQQAISPVDYYDHQRSNSSFGSGSVYGYSNIRSHEPKQGSITIGNGYSRENHYSHCKNYSIDQSQYYQQQQSMVPPTANTSPYHSSYCFKTGSLQPDCYCSCSYCLANLNSKPNYNYGTSDNSGNNVSWRHYYNNNNVSC